MKLGIRAIRYIPASSVDDYSYLAPGSSFSLSSFIHGSLTELPFTPETGDISEQWRYDDNGKYSDFRFKVSIRANREKYRSVLQQLEGQRNIYEIETTDGRKYVIGSREYLPTFTYTDTVSGQSTSQFSIDISLNSIHGALFSV